MKKRSNPVALALRLDPALKPKKVRPRKGKGSYSRKGERHSVHSDGAIFYG